MSYDTHLTESDIDRLLHERMPVETTRAAHHHLWRCRRCRKRLLAHAEAGLYLEEVYGAGTAAIWRETVEEPVDLLSRLVAQSDEMGEHSAPHLRMKITSSRRFQGPAALAVAIEQGYALRKEAPADAKTMLEGVIQALEDQHYWPREVRDYLRARAHAYHGNACRVLSERREAAASLTRAREYLERVEDPGLLGFVLGCEGHMEKDQGNYRLAVDKLHAALEVLPREREAVTRLETAITLANTYGLAGRWTQNVETLRTLVEEHPKSAFPAGAYLACLQSLALGYVNVDRPEEAEELLPEIRRVARAEGNRLDLVRVRWLEAEILKARGQRTLAATRFREVTSKFMAEGIPVDAALATLAQAHMYLELGDAKAAARLAEVLVPIFQSKGIHREATAAGLIVVEDLRREAATAAQVETLAERLQGVRPPARTRPGD